MKRTICHVIDYGGPTGGSFIPSLESLSRAVVGRGERFVVIATEILESNWPSQLSEAGAEVFLVTRTQQVIDRLRSLKPAIVHSHFTRFDGAILLSNANARLFWHVHSHREDRSVAARVKAILKYRLLSMRIEALVAVSNALADECVGFYAPRKLMRVVQNGIDTERFRPPTREERAAARNTFGINEDDNVVLFFERVPYKGGATLKAALRKVPDHRLLVAGGTRTDRDKFGGAPQVIAIERAADARELYWAANVLAFASDNEAFGFVLAEALACGLPVAASNIPIVREICGDVTQVSLFPSRDSEAMAKALITSVGREDANGRERIVALFNIGRWTADMLRLYDS